MFFFSLGILQILTTASPVFKTMFEKNNFTEGIEQEAKLPDKSVKVIIWMLDYLYPDTNGHLLSGQIKQPSLKQGSSLKILG